MTPRAHAFVADLQHPTLDDADRHHLARALRIRAGDPVTVSDGRGGLRECRFDAELEPVGPITRAPAPEPRLTLAFALTKGERPEWTVQKLTELGIDEIVPFVARRSVVHWDDDRRVRNRDRLRRVAREAAMQSRRTWLPDVTDVLSFDEAARRRGAVLADASGSERPSLRYTAVLVGPEGGWDDDERAHGLPAVVLAPSVLRAETAAVAAASMWCALRAGILRPDREV